MKFLLLTIYFILCCIVIVPAEPEYHTPVLLGALFFTACFFCIPIAIARLRKPLECRDWSPQPPDPCHKCGQDSCVKVHTCSDPRSQPTPFCRICWENLRSPFKVQSSKFKVQSFLLLYLLSSILTSPAAVTQIVTATLTVTNIPLGAPNTNLTVNGALRYWTNAQTGVSFLTNLAGVNQSKTNLYNQIAANPYTSPSLLLIDNGAASIQLKGNPLVILPQASNWCQITYTTNTVTNAYALMIPFDTRSTTNRTNDSAELVYGISLYSSNSFATNSGSLSNHLSLGVGPGGTEQQITQRKNFSGGLGVTGLGATNGFTRSLTNINPWFSNAVNQGNSFRSDGAGGNSLQLGSNALASGLNTTAVGNGARASNANATAIGAGALATNTYGLAIAGTVTGDYGTAVGAGSSAGEQAAAFGTSATAANGGLALGPFTTASGDGSVAIGNSDTVAFGENSTAVGQGAISWTNKSSALGWGAQANHLNSTALGAAASTTASNQVRLGTATDVVSIPGKLQIETGATNFMTLAGTNTWRGDLAYPAFALSTLAAGNNISVPFGTNVFIRLASGPASSPTICGIIGGATSGGRDGQQYIVFNDTGYPVVWAQNTVDPVPANRIDNQTAADVTVANQGWTYIMRDGQSSRWKITGTYPLSATATNAIANSGGAGTNTTLYGTTLSSNYTYSLSTQLVATNSTVNSNLTVTASIGTIDLFQTNSCSWTNLTGFSAGTAGAVVYYVAPQLVNRTQVWPTLGGNSFGVHVQTNANAPIFTSFTNGTCYAITWNWHGTNVLLTCVPFSQ